MVSLQLSQVHLNMNTLSLAENLGLLVGRMYNLVQHLTQAQPLQQQSKSIQPLHALLYHTQLLENIYQHIQIFGRQRLKLISMELPQANQVF